MAKIGALLRRPQSLLWHPHQKLWNWSLISFFSRLPGGNRVGQGAVAALVGVDSVLLAGRVLLRRWRRTVGSHRKVPLTSLRPRGLYIDCGGHKRGEQIRWMRRWFGDRYELHVLGFEASAEHVRDASAALADLDLVRLHHAALVGPDHVGDEVRLYKDGGDGKGDSLFAARGEEYEMAPARRLSQVLAAEGYVLGEIPVILRMNIEGAEQGVIEDLLDAGLHTSVDGYYGMWDDLSKIDPDADRRFRRLLRDHRISTITFNDRDLVTFDDQGLTFRLRDLPFVLRRYAIRTDVETSVRAGLARVKSGAARLKSR